MKGESPAALRKCFMDSSEKEKPILVVKPTT
jgi:hypothetical protein